MLSLVIVLPTCWVLLWIGKYLFPPHPKRFVLQREDYKTPYIYVQNMIDCNISKRPSIDREEVENVLNAIQLQIRSHDRDGIKHSYASDIYDLIEIVRKYNFEIDREMLSKVDDCIKLASYGEVCCLLEAKAIMQHCMRK